MATFVYATACMQRASWAVNGDERMDVRGSLLFPFLLARIIILIHITDRRKEGERKCVEHPWTLPLLLLGVEFANLQTIPLKYVSRQWRSQMGQREIDSGEEIWRNLLLRVTG